MVTVASGGKSKLLPVAMGGKFQFLYRGIRKKTIFFKAFIPQYHRLFYLLFNILSFILPQLHPHTRMKTTIYKCGIGKKENTCSGMALERTKIYNFYGIG